MRKIVALISLLSFTSAFSEPSSNLYWQDAQESVQQLQYKSINKDIGKALKSRILNLDEERLKQSLQGSTKVLSSRSLNAKPPQIEIDLPLPNGKFVRVRAIDSPILSIELATSYPDIKTWRVIGVDDAAISGRIDFTANGFHGMLVLADGETIFIDPDKSSASNVYHSVSKRDNQAHFKSDFNCEVHGKHSLLSSNELSDKELSGKKLAQIPADNLITYRLAVAGTGEYTGDFGNSKAQAHASMVTTINRVNEIYQRDLGVKLELVSGEQFVYTNATTDPYTSGNASALVSENMLNLHNNFGVNNYDIGHVFDKSPLGGLAYVGVACVDQANIPSGLVNGIKGGGATGLPNPQGELFSVDFVSHEIGHQLGANHTFNSTKNSCSGSSRTQATAVETGSGSTIMAYSGICDTDNLQFDADAMFHWKSIEQINDYTRVASIFEDGTDCGTRTSTGNQKPVADAGADSTIPFKTPFLLDGSATGGNSYAWDQIDAGTASAVDVDMGDNAIIRSLLPNADPDRYIPRLLDLFTGSNTTGEILPQTVRDVNFAFVVRDTNGGIDTDFKKISTINTGTTFSVLSHTTAETLSTGQSTNVTWEVASTDASPINCAKVNIQLLRSDGVKNDLLLDTNNDGVETIVVPGSTPSMTNARIMVACASQPFFQISTGDIAIQQGVDSTPPVITIIGSSTVNAIQGSTYNDQGATATDDFDPIVSVASVSTVNTAVIGVYKVTYTATDNANNTSTKDRTVNVIADTLAPVITLIGSSTLDIINGSSYTDAGATAIDNLDGSVAVTTTGSVDTSTIASYILTYSAVDAAGNISTSLTRTVNVIADTVPPVIVLVGTSTVNMVQGQTYIDAGATATDNFDTSVSVVSSGVVDSTTIGTYTITYSAVDAAGNITIPVIRTINVVADTVAPVITLFGASTINVTQGDTYSDSGASALDNVDGSVTVVSSGTVDTTTVGTYIITYTATDSAGNSASNSRIVNVELESASGGKTELSSGGSMGYLLLLLGIFGLRRRYMRC